MGSQCWVIAAVAVEGLGGAGKAGLLWVCFGVRAAVRSSELMLWPLHCRLLLEHTCAWGLEQRCVSPTASARRGRVPGDGAMPGALLPCLRRKSWDHNVVWVNSNLQQG